MRRILLLFFLFITLCASAGGPFKKTYKDVHIGKVLQEIEAHFSLQIMYRPQDLADIPPVTCSINTSDYQTALKQVLGKHLQYTVRKNIIVITVVKPQPSSAQPKSPTQTHASPVKPQTTSAQNKPQNVTPPTGQQSTQSQGKNKPKTQVQPQGQQTTSVQNKSQNQTPPTGQQLTQSQVQNKAKTQVQSQSQQTSSVQNKPINQTPPIGRQLISSPEQSKPEAPDTLQSFTVTQEQQETSQASTQPQIPAATQTQEESLEHDLTQTFSDSTELQHPDIAVDVRDEMQVVPTDIDTAIDQNMIIQNADNQQIVNNSLSDTNSKEPVLNVVQNTDQKSPKNTFQYRRRHTFMPSFSIGYGSELMTQLDLRYVYYFHRNWGVGTGLNFAFAAQKAASTDSLSWRQEGRIGFPFAVAARYTFSKTWGIHANVGATASFMVYSGKSGRGISGKTVDVFPFLELDAIHPISAHTELLFGLYTHISAISVSPWSVGLHLGFIIGK